MNMKELKEKINECYMRLQRLNITPTRENMEILLQTLYDLRDVYDKLERGMDDGWKTDRIE